MQHPLIDDAIRRIVEWGVAEPGEIVGCSPEEIRTVAETVGGRLPGSYLRFLGVAGKQAGRFFGDSSFFYPEMLSLREMAEDLLRDAAWTLKPTELPFATHEGYQFLFFDAAEGDDPPVWHYLELDPGPRVVAPSFSAWFAETAREESVHLGTRPARRARRWWKRPSS
jgi:hypothetical protein